jgi:signal transduction histidine kinase
MNYLRFLVSWLRYLWYRSSHLGIHEDMPFFERQKMHLINILVVPALPLILFFVLANLSARPGLAFLNFCSLVAYSAIAYINFSGRFLQWRMLFICLAAVVFFAEAFFYHNGMEYSMLLMVAAGIVIIDKKWHYYLFAFSIVSAFSYLKYYRHLQLNEEPGMLTRVIFNMFFCLLLFVIASQYFRKIYRNYHQQVQDNKVVLEQQQRQLLIQKWELEEKNRELKTLSDSRQRILFTLAHDLRNPLSGIEALAKRMLRMEGDTIDTHALLSVIETTADRSQKQIQELLDANQYLEIGEEIRKTLVNIGELVQEVLQPLQFNAAQKSIAIQMQLPGDVVVAFVNKMQFSRVVENLVANAVKFSHLHSVVTVELCLAEEEFILSVRDTGIGIAAEKRPFIFDNFTAARQAGTMGEKSFGLGLSICKQIVEAHGGTIQLAPGEQQGCTFLVKMPLGNQV